MDKIAELLNGLNTANEADNAKIVVHGNVTINLTAPDPSVWPDRRAGSDFTERSRD